MRARNITKRFDLNMGKRCNERCMFCYYLEEIESGNTRDRSTEQVKDILKVGRKWGKTRVDLTGGEPSIRKDLPEIIAFAREIGYETVCMITNGLVTAKKEKLAEFVDAGLNDILVSLHAHDAETHDYLVKVKGAHAKVLRTLANARELGLDLRVNHVVTNLNYKHVSSLAEQVVGYRPRALNYIVLNPTRDAVNADRRLSITYHDVGEELRRMLDAYASRLPTINIRHMPFCMLEGYEKHVKTMWQLQYEKAEWDWCMDIIHKRGSVFMYAAAAAGMASMIRHPRLYQGTWRTRLNDALQYSRILNDRRKPAECGRCDLRDICDGVPREHFADRGGVEVRPYTGGERISDPAHFMAADELEDPPREGDAVTLPGTPAMLFGQYRKRQPPMPKARPKAAPATAATLPGAGRAVLVEPPRLGRKSS